MMALLCSEAHTRFSSFATHRQGSKLTVGRHLVKGMFAITQKPPEWKPPYRTDLELAVPDEVCPLREGLAL